MRFLHTGARRGVLTPPLRADRAGAFANDPSTHPHPPFRKQVLT